MQLVEGNLDRVPVTSGLGTVGPGAPATLQNGVNVPSCPSSRPMQTVLTSKALTDEVWTSNLKFRYKGEAGAVDLGSPSLLQLQSIQHNDWMLLLKALVLQTLICILGHADMQPSVAVLVRLMGASLILCDPPDKSAVKPYEPRMTLDGCVLSEVKPSSNLWICGGCASRDQVVELHPGLSAWVYCWHYLRSLMMGKKAKELHSVILLQTG